MRELKLNVGCGRNAVAGWINIDNSLSAILAKTPVLKKALFATGLLDRGHYETVWPKDIVRCDVSKKLPFPDRGVSKIYSSHLLEHLSKSHGEVFIRECFRVLKREGVMRIVIPDLEFHARRYLERLSHNGEMSREAHDDLLWNIYGAYLEKRRFGASHRYMYDWPTMRALLKEAGFRRVVRQIYREGEDEEMNCLDDRPEDSLHVDAIK